MNFRRGEGIADKLGRIIGPGDDVDLFPPQFLHDVLYARALGADAGADRVDVGVAGINRYLGPDSRFAGDPPDGHNAFADFRDLGFEQFPDKAGIGAGEHDLRILGGLLNVQDVCLDPIPQAIMLPGHLLLGRQNRLGFAHVHNDVPPVKALHNAVYQFALAVLVVLVGVFALGLAYVLDDHLLGGLRGDSAEIRGVQLDPETVADLSIRIQNLLCFLKRYFTLGIFYFVDDVFKLEEFNLSQFLVEVGLDLAVVTIPVFCRFEQRGLQRLDQGILIQILVFPDFFQYTVKLVYHSSYL